MAKQEDMEKLNAAISILESTDLGLSLVWLWTWDIIKYNMADEEYTCTQTEQQMWDNLVAHVEAGKGFSLEFGAEQIQEDIRDWMFESGYLLDPEETE